MSDYYQASLVDRTLDHTAGSRRQGTGRPWRLRSRPALHGDQDFEADPVKGDVEVPEDVGADTGPLPHEREQDVLSVDEFVF